MHITILANHVAIDHLGVVHVALAGLTSAGGIVVEEIDIRVCHKVLVQELVDDFHKAVDDYLAVCEAEGSEPEMIDNV